MIPSAAAISTPSALFEEFRPKFEVVTVGLGQHSSLKQEGGDVIAFPLRRPGGFGFQYGKLRETFGEVTIDLAKARLRFSVDFDCSKGGTLYQLRAAIKREVEQLLAGRVFRLRPESPFTEFDCQASSERRGVLAVDGEPVPGLSFLGAGNWTDFVPPGTMEARKIEAAIRYHDRVRELEALGSETEALLAET